MRPCSPLLAQRMVWESPINVFAIDLDDLREKSFAQERVALANQIPEEALIAIEDAVWGKPGGSCCLGMLPHNSYPLVWLLEETMIFRLVNDERSLEIDLAHLENAPSLPSHGDAVLSIRVSSRGFSGESEVWVPGQALSSFCTALVQLERSLKGEAAIRSISPDELSLRFFAVSNRGRLAVEGTAGHSVQEEGRSYWHSVSFGFEFEPWQLSDAIKGSWVLHQIDSIS